MGALLGLGDCSLAFGDDGVKLRHLTEGGYYCAWCGDELPPRRRRWCSDACSQEFARQHVWSVAREAAKSRDGHMCRVCSRGWGAAHLLALFLNLSGHDLGRDLVDEEFAEIFRAWTGGANLEVNHVVPRRGAGYRTGCAHHVDGIETLCREHHVIETKRQAAHLLARRGPDDPRVEQLRLSA